MSPESSGPEDEPGHEILGEFARGGRGAILRVRDRDLRRTLGGMV